jgi:hypothetical protein
MQPYASQEMLVEVLPPRRWSWFEGKRSLAPGSPRRLSMSCIVATHSWSRHRASCERRDRHAQLASSSIFLCWRRSPDDHLHSAPPGLRAWRAHLVCLHTQVTNTIPIHAMSYKLRDACAADTNDAIHWKVLDLGRGRVWLHRSALRTLHVRVPLLLLTKCITTWRSARAERR